MSWLQGHAPATAGNSATQASASQPSARPATTFFLARNIGAFRHFERVVPGKNVLESGDGGRVRLDQNPNLVDRDGLVVQPVLLDMNRKHDITGDDREKHRPQD